MPPASVGLDPDFLRSLERLTMVARRIFPGQLKGEKRSPRHGSSVEFADFRTYAPGDDFRHVDWNVYARLERLFLKMFHEEEDLHLYLLLDVSESMRFGEPETKLDAGRKLAAALGYIGLSSLDRVAAGTFSDRLLDRFRLVRGRRHAGRLFRFLSEAGQGAWGTRSQFGEAELGHVPQAHGTDLAEALRNFAVRTRNRGVVVVISDFLDRQGYQSAIQALVSCHFDVNAIQVLTPEEVKPDLAGDLRLVDAETGDTREITVTGALLNAYRARVEAYCDELRRFCVRRGAGYARLLTTDSIEQFVLQLLRRSGVVA
ncbi:MAG: DUF58 domain-containing protein [Armatimonadetes bacterium]|nr:DUF58 domain-containing protein [Armatimonadota bacterium]